MMPKDVLSLIGTLVAVCLVLALAYLFTRYVVGRTALPQGWRRRHIPLLEPLPVGKDQKLLLIRVGEEVHLLGAAQGGVTYLRTIPKEEADRWEVEAEASQAPETGFQTALRDVLRQRKR